MSGSSKEKAASIVHLAVILFVVHCDYTNIMIINFKDDDTEKIFAGAVSATLPSTIQNAARRKLRYLDNAAALKDLRSPPGNRLEVLKRNRIGQNSIRINDQWRICFVWTGADAEDVEIVDYH